jgi:hypothetical protein
MPTKFPAALARRHLLAVPTLALAILEACLPPSGAQEPASTDKASKTVPGDLRTHATLHSIGIEWDLDGDTNHNATCKVEFRAMGAAEWRAASPLFRTDYEWFYGKDTAKLPFNLFAGSILFLHPDTEYEVRLDLFDPDGGAARKEFTLRTRPVPVLPSGGKTWHVIPGGGGGAGTSADPFRGIAAAEAAARPGDVCLLHKGNYGAVDLTKAGAEGGRYLAWRSAGDGECVFSKVTLHGDHLWVEGLTFRREADNSGSAIAGKGVEGAVVLRNRLSGFHYGIHTAGNSANWYIADNVITGDKGDLSAKDPEQISGEGVELGESAGGHVVCYNRISRVADGVSYPGRNSDIYGNEIFEVTDDGLEFDRGYANNRAWGNRITNVGNAAFSFQPMRCGPWYFLHNQVIAGSHEDTELREPHLFKFRVQDRYALVNNTFVCWRFLDVYSDCLFSSLCRNNLFISATGKKPLWCAFRYNKGDDRRVLPMLFPDWRTDVDYNGYDWGEDSRTDPSKEGPFRFHNPANPKKIFYSSLEEFSAAFGVEKHGRRVRKEEVFSEWTLPIDPVNCPLVALALKPGGNAVDAGSPLPNLAEKFEGKAPDLGASELGRPPMHFGPRDEQTMKTRGLDWAWY